jgi:hypothetical protein
MATEVAAPDTCRICRTPARDHAYICDTCRHQLDIALGDTTWVAEELDVSITRQKGVNLNGGGGKSAETPLPWHDKASEARRHLHGILVAWVRFCRDEHVRGCPAWSPQDNPASMARFLLHCTHGLALTDIGPDAYEEITKAVADAKRIIFWKKRSRTYLGPCEKPVPNDEGEILVDKCPGEVYAEEDAPVGTCDICEQGHTVVIRQAELNDKLDGRLCTAAELARICVFLGLQAPRERVRDKVHYWYRHKRITPHGAAPNGDPMFRYGEVRAMLYTEFADKVKS